MRLHTVKLLPPKLRSGTGDERYLGMYTTGNLFVTFVKFCESILVVRLLTHSRLCRHTFTKIIGEIRTLRSQTVRRCAARFIDD